MRDGSRPCRVSMQLRPSIVNPGVTRFWGVNPGIPEVDRQVLTLGSSVLAGLAQLHHVTARPITVLVFSELFT
jgi:hypothetical protein